MSFVIWVEQEYERRIRICVIKGWRGGDGKQKGGGGDAVEGVVCGSGLEGGRLNSYKLGGWRL